MTKFVKKSELVNNWYEIDAKNAVVGRIATVISKILRGKNKTTYTPHMDNGDFVIVKNIEHIKFTGNKFQNKKYYKLEMSDLFKVRFIAPVKPAYDKSSKFRSF